MAEPYLGEIRMFAGDFPPLNYVFCAGQILAISDNEALFSLLGTTYGGDGLTTFGLPDLLGRIPINAGQGPGLSNGYELGQKLGQETVTLTTQQIPEHNHPLRASTSYATRNTVNSFLLAQPGFLFYSEPTDPSNITSFASEQTSGEGDAHCNMMPTTCINFIICVKGAFPARN
ncbi:MAG: tail fiber protein [Pseudomonadota bacterium]|nr:tail fiber protein [Pseudomonadota bacterium]MEC8482482.1 tail fiber protein [Pseudomonadota bacterium]